MPRRKLRYRSFDIETTSLDPYEKGAEIFAYCIGDEQGNVGVYRLDGKEREREMNWRRLVDFFQDTSIAKVAHNYKFELSFLMKEGIDVPEGTQWHDTMIISQLLRNLVASHTLDYLCWELCGYSRELDERVAKAAKAYGNYQRIPIPLMEAYQKSDGERTMLLFLLWFDELCKDAKLYQDYLNEMELVKVTVHAEQEGIRINPKRAQALILWMENQLTEVREQVKQITGHYINIGSTEQVANLLFDKLGFSVITYTEGGAYSTDKNVLLTLKEQTESPIIDAIIKYRSYIKGKAIIKDYLRCADERDIIHPNINTNPTRTGRESSSKPNLQNVSKEEVLKNPFPVPARKVFIPKPGHLLFFADYAGIEMRLIINAAQEEELMQVLRDGGDPHGIAASYFFGERYTNELDAAIKGTLRSASKNCNFGLAYGAGLGTAARTLNMRVEEAAAGITAYCERFPRISNFTQSIIDQVRRHGYVMTPFGRKLYVPVDKAYIGANYLIQGTAAGILKRAQVYIYHYLREVWEDRIRIILPIHDELVFSFPKALYRQRVQILDDISNLMINIKEIKVPLEIEWKMTSTSWDRAKEV